MDMNELFASLDVPVLEKIAIGPTAYLDQLRSEDMSAPVMKGKDEKGRCFIAFRARESAQVKGDAKPWRERSGVITLFQRYSNREDLWVGGSRDLNSDTLAYPYSEMVDHVQRLVKDGRIVRDNGNLWELVLEDGNCTTIEELSELF